MKKIFYGYLFLYLNFSLNFGNYIVNFIPSFYGAFLIAQGMTELSGQSEQFSKGHTPALVASGFGLVTWLLDALGISAKLDTIPTTVIGLTTTVLTIVLGYFVVQGIRELETVLKTSLFADTLQTYWVIASLLGVGSYLTVWIPVAGLFCMLVGFLIQIVFLVVLNKAYKKYEETVHSAAIVKD